MEKSRTKRGNRDGGRFLALPHVVMDSSAFRRLSGTAVRLLLDIARQLTGSNNGKLVACMSFLKARGWNSNDTLTRARRELEASDLLFETRKGMRPNLATWYAVTWAALDWSSKMDIKRESFQRGSYAKNDPLPPIGMA